MSPEDSFDIDWPHQLHVAEAILNPINKKGKQMKIIQGPIFRFQCLLMRTKLSISVHLNHIVITSSKQMQSIS